MRTNLFGELDTNIETINTKKMGKYQLFRYRNNYRLSMDDRYCKTCKYCCKVKYNRSYYKCKLQGCGGSANSDIRLRNVCDLYEEV